MRQDWSWAQSAKKYVELYRKTMEQGGTSAAVSSRGVWHAADQCHGLPLASRRGHAAKHAHIREARRLNGSSKLNAIRDTQTHEECATKTIDAIVRSSSSALALHRFLPSRSAGAEPAAIKGKLRLDNFDYRGVTLDGGRMRMQLDEVRDDYLRIPNDDLLKGFRQRAGLAGAGQRSGRMVYRRRLQRLRPDRLRAGAGVCRHRRSWPAATKPTRSSPSGPSASRRTATSITPPSRTPRTTSTTRWSAACSTTYLYCGNKDALRPLSRITDWAIKNLDRSKPLPDGCEWYTLSENLYRAYLATGDAKYRDFAAVWEYPQYWDFYARNENPFGPNKSGKHSKANHAYSHVNTLGGAGAAYLVSGDSRYLDILRNAYDCLQAYQVFATGCYGPDEQLLPRKQLLDHLSRTTATAETQCGAWAVFKMVKYLLRCTGDARYGDWAERIAINGLGAAIPMAPDGRVFYYSDYNPHGGMKRIHGEGWSCCAGTRIQATADCCDLAYFKDADNLYVNLFTPSTVKWPHAGANVTVHQTTRFPEDGTVEFTRRDRPAGRGRPEDSHAGLAGRADDGQPQRRARFARNRFAPLVVAPPPVEHRRSADGRAADAALGEPVGPEQGLSGGDSLRAGRVGGAGRKPRLRREARSQSISIAN